MAANQNLCQQYDREIIWLICIYEYISICMGQLPAAADCQKYLHLHYNRHIQNKSEMFAYFISEQCCLEG